MDQREELAALRRLAELEARAGGAEQKAAQRNQDANSYAGEDVGAMGTVMRGLGGAKHAWDKAAMGLKGMFTELTPEDKALLQQGEAFTNEGGTAAKVGQIGADIAMTAAPVARGMQAANAGIKMLPKAAQFIGKGGVLQSAASGGAVSAALDPEDRASAATGGALGGALGQGIGNALTKTLGGIVSNSVTPEAKALMDQGVSVPLWKATDSRVLRDVAERTKVLPVVGNIMRSQERRGFEDFNRMMANRANPNAPVLDEAGNVLRWEAGKPIKSVGSEALDELGGRFNNAYDALYKGRMIPIDAEYKGGVNNILDSLRNYKPEILSQVEGRINQINNPLSGVTDLEKTAVRSNILDESGAPIIKDTLESGGHVGVGADSIKEAIQKATGEAQMLARDGKNEAAQVMRDYAGQLENLRTRGLPPEVASEAADVNKAYATFKQLQRANTQLGAQNAGVTSPRQMLSAIKSGDKSVDKGRFASGNSLNQEDVLRADQVLGSRIPEVGPGTAEKLLPAIGFGLPMMGYDAGLTALLGTKTGQRALMGKLPGQAGIRKYGNEYLVPALRSLGVAEGN